MEITFLGNASFRIKGNDTTIITDPFSNSKISRITSLESDILTISQNVPSTSDASELADHFHIIDTPGEYAIGGVSITGIRTPQMPDQISPNTSYFLEIDGLTLCHVGNLNSAFASPEVDHLIPIDVLLIPTSPASLIDLGQVRETIQTLTPKILIPMSYDESGLQENCSNLKELLGEMGDKDAEPQSKLNVTLSNIPAEPKLILLRPVTIRGKSN